MLLDHVGMIFVPTSSVLGVILRVLGRLAAPIFCLFLAEGYFYTSNKLKYGIRLFVFAVISQSAYSFSHYGKVFVFDDYNMMFTLFLSFMCLVCLTEIKNGVLKWLAIAALICLSYFCDWGIFAPAWVLVFYLLRGKPNKIAVCFSILSALVVLSAVVFNLLSDENWYGQLWQAGLFLFVPFLYLYDGQKCKSNAFNKWFFYLFYSLHLVALALIKMYL